MTPIVKWAGGKTQLLPELVKRIPLELRTKLATGESRYHELFAGGAALFFHLQPANRPVLNDLNKDLIRTYEAIQQEDLLELVLRRLAHHQRKHDEKHYYRTRAWWNDMTGQRLGNARDLQVREAAAFLYLNRTCFNGLWRVNANGQFNVPVGRYKNPAICRPAHLRQAHATLKGAVLYHGDYGDAAMVPVAGDVVYVDPPYDPITPESFTGYTAASFGPEEQSGLARTVQALGDLGCHVLVSNSDTRFVRELYRGARIDRVMAKRTIGGAGGKAREVIITAGPWAKAKKRGRA